MTTVQAYSYIRFSSPRQQHSDSLRRQLDTTRSYVAEQGWQLDDSLDLHDLGVSAWRSGNVEKKLGTFLAAVESGRVPKGSVLVIESLDRLSRDKLDPAYELFRSILRSSIDIVTLSNPPEHFTADDLNNPFKMMLAIISIFRANDESEWKSKRIAAAWESKRQQAAVKKLTSICPSWLELSEDRTRFIPIPEAVKAIKLICNLYLDGHGCHRIVKRLNKDGVPPITKGKRRKTYWVEGTINKLLTNRALIGEHQPCKGRHQSSRPVGDPIPNYFPAVISNDVFLRIQQKRKRHVAGRQSKQLITLFPRLIHDARDKSVMNVVRKTPVTTDKNRCRLVSSDALRGVGQGYWSFPYALFEGAFLRWIDQLTLDDISTTTDSTAEEIAAAQLQVDSLDTRIKDIKKKMDTDSRYDALADKVAEWSGQRTALAKHIKELNLRRSTPIAKALSESQSIIDQLAKLTGEKLTEARLRLRARIGDLVESIWVLVYNIDGTYRNRAKRAADVQVFLRSGENRIFLVTEDDSQVVWFCNRKGVDYPTNLLPHEQSLITYDERSYRTLWSITRP